MKKYKKYFVSLIAFLVLLVPIQAMAASSSDLLQGDYTLVKSGSNYFIVKYKTVNDYLYQYAASNTLGNSSSIDLYMSTDGNNYNFDGTYSARNQLLSNYTIISSSRDIYSDVNKTSVFYAVPVPEPEPEPVPETPTDPGNSPEPEQNTMPYNYSSDAIIGQASDFANVFEKPIIILIGLSVAILVAYSIRNMF